MYCNFNKKNDIMEIFFNKKRLKAFFKLKKLLFIGF